jgi:hypothetical protein
VFKWICLLVAVVALAAYGWMLNDVRLEVKSLAPSVAQLTVKTEDLVDKMDKNLPTLITHAEKTSTQIDRHLPRILNQTETAAATINTNLPPLLNRTEVGLDNLIDLSDSFKQYKGLMGIVHAASQNKGLFSYGSSILGFLGGSNATIGLKKPGPEGGLKQPMAAKDWAAFAMKDNHFLSLVAKSKEDMLHGLARTNTAAPLHIQVGNQPPRPLADWLKETHPESKDVK